MIRFALPFCLGLGIASAAHGQAPTWTILRSACWTISENVGQCAVNVLGRFATRDACINANGKQLDRSETIQGMQYHDRCEMLLE